MAHLFYSAEKARRSDLAHIRQQLLRLGKLSPENIARELDRHCPYCGDLLVPRVEEREVMGRWRPTIIYPDRHGCTPEQESLAREAAARAAEQEASARLADQRRLRQAGLVGWLAEATFDNFVSQPGSEAGYCREQVRAYVATLADAAGPGWPNWLVLHGHYGAGKSHLAAAAIRTQIDRGRPRCYFRSWTDYLLRLQASWQPPDDNTPAETEAGIIAELQAGNLVVIDDLDKRRPTPWTQNVLFSVLNYRYNARLPTILTFNHGPKTVDPARPERLALETYLGGAVLDRLLAAACGFIKFNGPSYRSGVDWEAHK